MVRLTDPRDIFFIVLTGEVPPNPPQYVSLSDPDDARAFISATLHMNYASPEALVN